MVYGNRVTHYLRCADSVGIFSLGFDSLPGKRPELQRKSLLVTIGTQVQNTKGILSVSSYVFFGVISHNAMTLIICRAWTAKDK